MLKMTVYIGAPCFVNFVKIGDIVFLSASEQSILAEALYLNLQQTEWQLLSQNFIISAAYGTPIRSSTATKGLSKTPTSEIGNNADNTTIVPTKKIINLHNVVRMAFGITFSRSSVSPAAIPINSVPEKAKLTASIIMIFAKAPFGNKPDELVNGEYIQSSEEILAQHHYVSKTKQILFALLDQMEKKVPKE